MIHVINKHLVVLIESRESIERRESKPRARRRYIIMCTCNSRRRPDGHCMHTQALLEDQVKPERWRDITPEQMSAPDSPKASPHYGRKPA